MSHRLQFIDSARFMTVLLSNLVDNLAKYTNCTTGCRDYKNPKDDLIESKYLC